MNTRGLIKSNGWSYKEYVFPYDVPLLLRIGGLTLYYYVLIRNAPLDRITGKIAAKKDSCQSRTALSTEDEQTLDKIWRAATCVLCRLLQTSTPCLCRTLVIHHWFGGRVSVKIGIVMEGRQLKSHAWVEVKDKAFRENPAELLKYTLILEW